MADTFHYYHSGLSQRSRAVLLLLKRIDAPHEVHPVDFLSGDQLKPEFVKMNPFHQVPVLTHGDFILSESTAIARYIVNVHKSKDHWYPTDPKQRARVEEFLSYHHTTIRKAGIQVAWKFLLTQRQTGKPTSEEEKQQAMKCFHEVLEGFEGYFLKNGSFIVGDEISIADLFAVSEILQADFSGVDYLSAHPNVKEFIERTKAATQPHFDEVFTPLNEFVKANVK